MYIIHSLTAHKVLLAHIYLLCIMFPFCTVQERFQDTFHCVLYSYNYACDKLRILNLDPACSNICPTTLAVH